MDIINIFILISACINLFLCLIIYTKSQNRLANIVFSMFAFSVVAWSVAMVVYRGALSIRGSIGWCKALYASPVFIVVFLVWFAYIFPEETTKKIKHRLYLVFGGGLTMLMLLLLTDGVIVNVVISPGEEKIIIFGVLYYLLYTSFISGYFLWVYIILLKKIYKSRGITRIQLIYVFAGIALGSIFGMFSNLLLPTLGSFNLNWLGQITSIVMVAFIFYAIVRHRLMDIKVVLRKYSVYTASLISIILPALIIKFLIYTYFAQTGLWLDFIILIVAISVFPTIKNYYYRVANKYFFSSLYDGRQVIADLSDKLSSTLEVDKIYKYISDTLINSFHAQAVGILTYNEKENVYAVQYNKGFKPGKQKSVPISQSLQALFIKPNNVLVVEEIKERHYAKHKKIINLLADFGVEIVVPLNLKDKTIGLVVLGAKESKDMYNEEDLGVLDIIGDQAAIALENALLYEETRNFGKKLEKEVIKATKQLRAANKELRQLDAAKSEFISIASHQLRTPLSIIKGYISMILEGTYGKLAQEKREILEKVYVSNERLIQLVENLLNVSRIEAGKLQFSFRKTQINDIVISVIDELKSSAVRKEQKLIYKEPTNPLPKINADGEKIRQVIINLVDNAIKYSGRGDITICLERTDNKILFRISDPGIGIRREDLANLFKKFSRGGKTPLIHPEGIGLGLYVAQTMINAHQGRIWVKSKGEGRGTTFYFALPINLNPLPKKK